MKQFILSFIPDKYKTDEQVFKKARLFVNTSFITSFFSFFYLVSSYLSHMSYVFGAMVFNVIGFILLPLLFKTNRFSLKFLASCYIAVGGIGVLIVVFNTGGLVSSILPWLAVLPITSLMLIDKTNGWIWTILSYFSITIIGILAIFGYRFNDETGHTNLLIFNTANLNGLGVLIFLIALVFENTTKTALSNLAAKNNLLDIERNKTNDLLLNILPAEIAEELKSTGTARTKAYTMVTVMFTDFKDFTEKSELVSGEVLVDELHHCFSAFDLIIQKYKIEKIKTIGDAYLCAGGIPVSSLSHAKDITNAAIEIRNFMIDRKKEQEAKGELSFEMRIGINSGPIVAGIVGVKKFEYDIWGDTVNTASRIEVNSEPGKINISGSTYSLIKDEFTCEYRGKISVKGKGEVDMYFVES